MFLPSVNWEGMFVFTVSPLELFIRGTLIYLLIFVLMRILRREPGTVGIADLLMVVLIADASQNAMAGEYRSVSDGFVLVLTIVFWNYAIDWITVRSRIIERFTYPDPIPLMKNGELIRENMRREFVTYEQLMSILREHGIEDVSKVKSVYIEGSGHTSVIPNEDEGKDGSDQGRRSSAF